MAICTSGEPVSVAWVRLASITAVFSSLRIMVGFHLSYNVPWAAWPAGESLGTKPGVNSTCKSQAVVVYHILPAL